VIFFFDKACRNNPKQVREVAEQDAAQGLGGYYIHGVALHARLIKYTIGTQL